MSEKFRPWFEHEFPGGYPVELFANLYGRLYGARARVEDLVEDVGHEQLVKTIGGTWSMQRNVGHLIDLEKLWLSRVEDYLAGHQSLTPADLENRATHDANHDHCSMDDLLSRFQQLRTVLLNRIGGLDRQQLELTARHPRLGQPMRMIDSLLFVVEHDDHHIARLIELRRLLGVESSSNHVE